MSKIKNGGLDQYGAESFERQQFGPAGNEGVNLNMAQHRFQLSANRSPANLNALTKIPLTRIPSAAFSSVAATNS